MIAEEEIDDALKALKELGNSEENDQLRALLCSLIISGAKDALMLWKAFNAASKISIRKERNNIWLKAILAGTKIEKPKSKKEENEYWNYLMSMDQIYKDCCY